MRRMAKRSETLHYTKRIIDIYFPEDKVCCDLCPLEEQYSRKQCRRTGEILVDGKTTGYWCPLMDADGKRVNYYSIEPDLKQEEEDDRGMA